MNFWRCCMVLTFLCGSANGDDSRILWIGAHPDDEVVVAPVLVRRCKESSVHCTLLVLTRGERGNCVGPEGCSDLGAIRAREVEAAARYLHAEIIQWDLADVMSDVRGVWDAGKTPLAKRIALVMEETRASAVLTFDPRHGTTCHPAHRAVGALVMEAVATLTTPPAVEFLETTVEFRDGFTFGQADVKGGYVAADSSDWRHLVAVMKLHRSQFAQGDVDAVEKLPAMQQRIHLAPAQEALLSTFRDSCASAGP